MTDYRTDHGQNRSGPVYVERHGSRGMSFTLFVLGAVVALLAVIWFAWSGPAVNPATGGDTNVTIETPTEVPATPEAAVPMTPTPDTGTATDQVPMEQAPMDQAPAATPPANP